MSNLWKHLSLWWGVWRASSQEPAALAAQQQQRLGEPVSFVRLHSFGDRA
jgi:hypothetical protein